MAVVEFCSRVDPKDAGHIRQQVKALLGEDIKDHFEGARRSPEYEDAHRAIEAVLDELPLRDAVQACQAI